MYIPGISPERLAPRKGGGGRGTNGKGGGGKSGSGKSGSSGGSQPKTLKVGGLPSGRNKATTYGKGGGNPVYVKSGRFNGSYVGGGTRGQVYGTGYYPSTGVSNVIPFGFLSVAVYLEVCYLSGSCSGLNYYGLPRDTSRPGGEVVEVAISPKANHNAQFLLISDKYSAAEVRTAIMANCSNVKVGDPIPFNSTGDLRSDTVVQFYRGDSAAILLQGYKNTGELPGRSDLAPNPPFPPSINMTTWACLNHTIGEAIPLMNDASSLSPPPAFLGVFVLFVYFLQSIL